VTEKMPMFPLNTVLFPGVSVPLHVFEDRYRALVHRLISVEDPADRLFGTVAFREGYAVGDHGAQSLHRIGCYLQLTDSVRNDDGTFDILAVGRGRIRLDGIDGSGSFLEGTVERLEDGDGEIRPETVHDALATFETYRRTVSEVSDADVLVGELPHDPTYLSWSLAATCLLTMRERQDLLEATNAAVRLVMVTGMLRRETQAMRAIPSLPATDVSRNRWSPN
jgi:Lon protease-like protein